MLLKRSTGSRRSIGLSSFIKHVCVKLFSSTKETFGRVKSILYRHVVVVKNRSWVSLSSDDDNIQAKGIGHRPINRGEHFHQPFLSISAGVALLVGLSLLIVLWLSCLFVVYTFIIRWFRVLLDTRVVSFRTTDGVICAIPDIPGTAPTLSTGCRWRQYS